MKKQSTVRIISIFAVVLVAVAAGVMALGFKKAPTANDQKLQIVAAENFWGNIASQIGGSNVEVTSIISDPSADPHLYESDAHDAAALSRAAVVISNGLGYDDFMNKLLAVSRGGNRTLLSVDKILNVSGYNPNPHLWYDIPRIGEVADAFEKAMAQKDPRHAKAYEANLTKFKTSLQPITATLQKIKASYSGSAVAYTERVPEYLLHAAGLSVKTPVGFSGAIEEGNDPSPADTAAMDALFTEKRVRVLFYNAQATSSVTEHVHVLASQAGIPVIGVTETLPKGEATYQSWQLHQVEALLKALQNK